MTNGEVVVAGLDAAAGVVRVQRIDANDRVVADRAVLTNVAGSTDAEIKVSANPTEGVAVTWRGLRAGKLVRQLVVLGPDLAPRGEPTDVSAASCATTDAVWLSDGKAAIARSWKGATRKVELPKEEDSSLLCGASHAFALIESEDRTGIVPLSFGDAPRAPLTVLRESEFGDDEQRELAEYTVGEDVGIVRLGMSGTIGVREITKGALGPLRKLKTSIPKDDDVVAVDASPKVLVIVFTQDVSSACPSASGSIVASTKVSALRVDRQTFEESTVEISPGRCEHEVGPFFTGVVGDGVSVAWTERTGGLGRARAPIAGLAHVVLAQAGNATLARIEQAVDALVDAGCDGTRCYAAALVPGDAGAASSVRVLRY